MKSALGLPVNAMAALCYVPFVGWMAALVVLVLEKEVDLRWQAVQSLLTYAVFLGITQAAVPMMRATVVLLPLAAFIGGLAGVGFLGLWLWLAIETNQGKKIKLPVLGVWTDKLVK